MLHLTISVDYDGTFTADPIGMSAVIRSLRQRGHRVIIVTAREKTEDNFDEIESALKSYGAGATAIYMTSSQAKRSYMENLGIIVNVWIDDNPQAVVSGCAVGGWVTPDK